MDDIIAKNKDMDEKRDIKRDMIYLAALLHDIGKFYQRADKKFSDKFNELSKFSKQIANDICPVNDQGRFGYQHVVWTNEFFERQKSIFDKVDGLRINPYENKDDDNLVTFACNHHKPQTILQAIITMADGWSAGIDRQNPEDIKEKNYGGKYIEWGKERYKTIPLFSIFNIINDGEGEVAFPLKPLGLKNDNLYPKKIQEKKDGISQNEYKKLWDDFLNEFKVLPTDSFDGFTESLLFLLKKYTWAIPSNTMDMANISLFEHLKTTAAFADTIYTYYLENSADFNWNASNKKLKLKENKYPVMLYGFDISGIQKFIYNISSNKAAKSLKGRSFYLQLLVEAMVQRIITHQDIKATIGHIIYSSGGKFYMLLPNTDKVKKALKDLKNEFERDLWEEHKGKISVNTSFVPFAYRSEKENGEWQSWIEMPDAGDRKNLGDLWKAVADKINIEKDKPFESFLSSNWEEFFNENNDKLKVKAEKTENEDGEVKIKQQETCAVTGEVLNRPILLDKDAEGNPIFVSKAVKDQTDLGTTLKDADYLIMYKGNIDEDKYLKNKAKTYISILGTNFYLFDDLELIKDDADFRGITSSDTSRIYRINTTDFLAAQLKGKSVSYGFLFYGGNKQALINDKEKTFEQLTQIIPGDKNTETYLGVLRMDIDNLGNIFIKGFDEKQKSFAGYATLSFLLDLFFSGYLNTIRNKDEYKDLVNILYSGGDDVFAIGRWDKLIDFAEEIRKDFRDFVGRDDITISAGMATVRNKFPISKAADLAGKAEDQSKDYNSGAKNAFTFFGETVSWKDEFDFINDYKQKFLDRIQGVYGKEMSKAILHRLMLFAEIKKENERRKNEPGFKPDLSYKWNTAYYLKRFSQRHKENSKEIHKEFIMNDLMPLLFQDNKTNRNYEKIALACRWAELILKIDKQLIENKFNN